MATPRTRPAGACPGPPHPRRPLGAPSGHGLWRSTGSGATWSKASSFPDPTGDNSCPTDEVGVVRAVSDETTGTSGNRT